jgi:hypothetical protein
VRRASARKHSFVCHPTSLVLFEQIIDRMAEEMLQSNIEACREYA